MHENCGEVKERWWKHPLHHLKYALLYGFVLGSFFDMARYPIEHTLWEKVPPFPAIAEYFGISIVHEEEHHE